MTCGVDIWPDNTLHLTEKLHCTSEHVVANYICQQVPFYNVLTFLPPCAPSSSSSGPPAPLDRGTNDPVTRFQALSSTFNSSSSVKPSFGEDRCTYSGSVPKSGISGSETVDEERSSSVSLTLSPVVNMGLSAWPFERTQRSATTRIIRTISANAPPSASASSEVQLVRMPCRVFWNGLRKPRSTIAYDIATRASRYVISISLMTSHATRQRAHL
jgi:hypothetical protein